MFLSIHAAHVKSTKQHIDTTITNAIARPIDATLQLPAQLMSNVATMQLPPQQLMKRVDPATSVQSSVQPVDAASE